MRTIKTTSGHEITLDGDAMTRVPLTAGSAQPFTESG